MPCRALGSTCQEAVVTGSLQSKSITAKEKYSVTTPIPQTLGMGLHGNVTPSHDLLCDVVLGFHQALKASEPMAVSV